MIIRVSSSSLLILYVSLLAVAIVFALLVTADDTISGDSIDSAATNPKIDLAKCRELGFASPASGVSFAGTGERSSSHTVSPSCGTCDVIAELLKATTEEKASQSTEERKTTIALKRRLVGECRSCCSPGYFDDDDSSSSSSTGVVGQQQRLLQQRMAGATGGAGALSGTFVSVVIEVDKEIANNRASEIYKFINTYGSSWDKNKISVVYSETIAPRLLLRRVTTGTGAGAGAEKKDEIMNVGNWEAELIWQFLKSNLAN